MKVEWLLLEAREGKGGGNRESLVSEYEDIVRKKNSDVLLHRRMTQIASKYSIFLTVEERILYEIFSP